MNRTRTRVAGVAALALVWTTCAGGVAGAEPVPEPTDLTWTDCGDGLQCASLPVPADWRDPDGPATAVEVARLPALDPATGQGPLVVNTGGPTTTIGVLRAFPNLLDGLRRDHDIVMMDPRALGDRTRVVCPGGLTVDLETLNRADWDRYTEAKAANDVACRASGGAVADHLTSWQVANDLDALRGALGRDRLDYFGNSYGTLYGQTYAELFPERVGRMYLDSVLDHTGPGTEPNVFDEASVTEANFHRFASWCADTPDCALHGTDVVAAWDGLRAAAERAPLPTADGAGVSAARLAFGTADLLGGQPYGGGLWPELAKALAAAIGGDASGLDNSAPPDPQVSLYSQTVCSDFPIDMGFDAVVARDAALRAETPRVGWTVQLTGYRSCVGLDLVDTYEPHPIAPVGLPPVLLANGTTDTATPLAGAEEVAAQLPGSRLVTVDGGHASYLQGNRCVREHVERFLAAGTLPAEDTTCGFDLTDRPQPPG